MTPPSPAPPRKRLIRILAPLVLAAGLMLAMEIGLVDRATATLSYDLTDIPAATALRVTLIDPDGADVAKAYFNLKPDQRAPEQTLDLAPGLHTARALVDTPAGQVRAEARADIQADGAYSLRLSPAPTR